MCTVWHECEHAINATVFYQIINNKNLLVYWPIQVADTGYISYSILVPRPAWNNNRRRIPHFFAVVSFNSNPSNYTGQISSQRKERLWDRGNCSEEGGCRSQWHRRVRMPGILSMFFFRRARFLQGCKQRGEGGHRAESSLKIYILATKTNAQA